MTLGPAPTTFPALLRRAARGTGGIAYVGPGDRESFHSYGELLAAATDLARGLESPTPSRHPVILLYETPRELIEALWGCLLAGRPPLPLEAGAIPASAHAREQLQRTWEQLDGPPILCDPVRREALTRDVSPELTAATDPASLSGRRGGLGPIGDRSGSPVALLLATSGTTGAPKLAALTEQNLLTGVASSVSVNGFTSADVSLNWLSLTHVGALMRSFRDVFLGATQVQLATSDVLAEPLAWLDAIERHGVTNSWAPDFAFRLLLRRLEAGPERRWRLEALRSLWTSGEPIAPDTMLQVSDRLRDSGLTPAAFHASWGMTEACSATCSHTYLLDLQAGAAVPEVGRPVPGVELRIVGDDGTRLGETELGRLQIRGPLVAAGYAGSPEVGESAFTADGWLRTGDLASLRAGRLTVAGRESDVVIVRGVNRAAVEIERVAAAAAGAAVSHVAACADVRLGSDRSPAGVAVFFVPVGDALPDTVSRLRAGLARELGLGDALLVPLAAEELPRSPVGKIRRGRLRELLASGRFGEQRERLRRLDQARPSATGAVEAPGTALASVTAAFAAVLGRSELSAGDDFFALGGGSVQVAQLVTRLREVDGFAAVEAADLFRCPTPRQLADWLASGARAAPLDGPSRASRRRAAQGVADLQRATRLRRRSKA